MAEVLAPAGWMAPDRELLLSVRQSMGLGRKAFAECLNDVIGPVEYPAVPVSWHAVHVWETAVRPPAYVVDAALMALRGSRPVVDLDVLEVAA
ncbi:hypothetical protein [Nocardia terpenica]|nr:hypothetical protein [Nocardia terpenica]NQE86904.1 hypothetical protein [Nocardia terpenica]NQE93442.1 hypothetical protein [Nocardia terpenica]